MNEPRRLLDGETTELGKTLLSAARDDGPTDTFVQRTLVAVGAGAAVMSAASVAAGIASSAGTAAAEAAPTGGVLLVAKWLGIGATAGLVSMGAVDGVARLAAPAEPPAATVSVAARAAPRATQTPLRAVAAPVATAKQQPAAPAHPPKASFDPVPQSGVADLAPEVAALDQARAAVGSGDSSRALGELDAYARRFPDGRLAQEAAFLRMEALERRGDATGATAAARDLLARWPDSPHAARARQLTAR